MKKNTQITKRKDLSPKIKAELEKHGIDLQVGDIVIETHGHSDGEIFRVDKIDKDGIHIEHEYDEEWCSYGTIEYEEFTRRGYVKLDKPIEELEIEVLEQLKDVDLLLDKEKEIHTETTALATAGSKETLLAHERKLQEVKNKFALMKAVLDRKHNELCYILEDFEKQITKVRKVLGVIELYLGIHEELVQIQEGPTALASEPIHIRQQLLYMDEEVGDPTDGGLDFRELEDFDNWILEEKNLAKTLPETKGVVALRVRRQDKAYSDNSFVNSIMNAENHKTYLLIRNGYNIYRIWSNVTVSPRLFPRTDEFEPKKRESGDYWPFDEDKIKESAFEYKKYGLMLQGILHRTQIFQPIDTTINVFQPDTWKGMLKFIKDDEATLPTGKLSWRDWRKEINSKIGVGSRIIYSKQTYWDKDFMNRRVVYGYTHCCPPSSGMYTVVPGSDGKEDEDNLRFYYLPKDEVYVESPYWGTGEWGKDYGYLPRRKRVGFKFYLDEVLNYDQILLEDIEFYLESRVDRHNYVDMIPILWQLKKQRLGELEHEKHFVSLVANRNSVDEEAVWKAVEWWKNKNKWKRPIEEDDAKALRMIERRIKK